MPHPLFPTINNALSTTSSYILHTLHSTISTSPSTTTPQYLSFSNTVSSFGIAVDKANARLGLFLMLLLTLTRYAGLSLDADEDAEFLAKTEFEVYHRDEDEGGYRSRCGVPLREVPGGGYQCAVM